MAAFDIRFSFGSFASTSSTFEAISDKGCEFIASMFGAGAISGTLPKTKGNDLMVFAQRTGLACEALVD